MAVGKRRRRRQRGAPTIWKVPDELWNRIAILFPVEEFRPTGDRPWTAVLPSRFTQLAGSGKVGKGATDWAIGGRGSSTRKGVVDGLYGTLLVPLESLARDRRKPPGSRDAPR